MRVFFLKVWNWALVIVFLAGILFFYTGKDIATPRVLIAGQSVKVELADTNEERTQGLSGRASLPSGTGLLFIFDAPAPHSFWMKDMNFPIDIIWISEEKNVAYIVPDADPSSYPAIFTPEQNAKYVLELPAGFSRKNNLKAGDRVEIILK